MSEAIEYRGFSILARPVELRDPSRWSLAGQIGRGNAVRPYSAKNTFDTREEAILRSLQFGRDIIDGKVPGLSVEDL